MGSVTGTYEHSIDAKGRLFIPAKLREELGDTFYLAMGVDTCLAIYPQESWDRFTEKFASLPVSKSKDMRSLFANAPTWGRTWSSSACTTGLRSGARRAGTRRKRK